MTNWIMIDYIFGIIDSFLMFYFADKFLTKKEVNIKHIILIILIQAAINHCINQVLGIANLWGLVIMAAVTGILFSKIFNEKFLNITLLILVGLVLISIIEIIVVVLIMSIIDVDSTIFFVNNIYRIVGGITSKIIMYFSIKHLVGKIRLKKMNCFHKTHIYQIIFVLGLNIIVIFSAIEFYRHTHIIKGNVNKYIVLVSLVIIIFTMAILSITKKIIEYAAKEVEWNLREREYKRQNFYVRNMDEMLMNLRAHRHDFNHHINCLYGLISMEEFEEVKVYIGKLTKEAKRYNEIINVGNPILTSLLNVKMTQARYKKIEVETNIEINKDLSIEHIDLSIIIGNLLDNSIEACEEVEEGNRYIEINIYHKMRNLIVKVINTKQQGIELKEKINKGGFTTKQDVDNHGFGFKNIKQIVEKYRGIIKIEDEEEIFKVNIAIPIKSDL